MLLQLTSSVFGAKTGEGDVPAGLNHAALAKEFTATPSNALPSDADDIDVPDGEAIATPSGARTKYASAVTDPGAPVIEVTDITVLPPVDGVYPTFDDAAESLSGAGGLTVLARFSQSGSDVGSLFSVSNSSENSSHFHLYVSGGRVGYEVRGAKGFADVNDYFSNRLTPGQENAVAFVMDSASHTYKTFVNGELLYTRTMTQETYRPLADISGLDAVTMGKTPRAGTNAFLYPFTGTITALTVYAGAIPDDDAAAWTAPLPPVETDMPVISLDGPITFPDDSYPSFPAAVETLSQAQDLTVTAQFTQTGGSVGSLFIIGNNARSNTHFHLYANGDTLGFELRDQETSGLNRHVPVFGLSAGNVNTVALKFDSEARVMKILINGRIYYSQNYSVDEYRSLVNIDGLNNARVGITDRSINHACYPFVGTIRELAVYDKSFDDSALLEYTGKTLPPEPELADPQPFYVGDSTGASHFRIPGLIALENGDQVAAIDARFDTNDSPANIDTVVRVRDATTGNWGEAQIINHFLDYPDYNARQGNSASFIDSELVQADSGRVFILTDAFPSGGGALSGVRSSGMVTVNGKKYVALTDGSSADALSTFQYYIGDDKKVYNRSSSTATPYTVDGDFNLYKDGEPLYCEQYITGDQIPMNVFYSGLSQLKVQKTSYLWMRYSDDNGQTWSDGHILNAVKSDNEIFLGVGPGQGMVIQNGQYAGRIIFPVYDSNDGMRASVIYSDDNGETWHRGGRTAMAASNSPGMSSESAVVELNNGVLRLYSRGRSNYIGYSDSADGGATRTP